MITRRTSAAVLLLAWLAYGCSEAPSPSAPDEGVDLGGEQRLIAGGVVAAERQGMRSYRKLLLACAPPHL